MLPDNNDVLLELSRFSCYYSHGSRLVDQANLTVSKGKIIGITGVSGEGKSTLLRCMAGFHPLGAPVQKGHIKRRGLKTEDLALVFQHADSHLNPIRKIGNQLMDLPLEYDASDWKEMLEAYGLKPGDEFYGKYPYMNSGGQNQRIGWMMSLAQHPKLLLADEPVSNLDEALKSFFSLLLKNYIRKNDAAAVVVSHDTAWLSRLTDRLYLLECGSLKKYVHAPGTNQGVQKKKSEASKTILTISQLTFRYPGQKSSLLNDLSLKVKSGTIIGIAGASGKGKSTLLKIITGNIATRSGLEWSRDSTNSGDRAVLIEQDPTEEFHPLFGIRAQLMEYSTKNEILESHWMKWVQSFGLQDELLSQKPAALSGGQLQRCAIIKALLSRPSLLLMDESFSGLDDAHFFKIIAQLEQILEEEEMSLILVMHRLVLLKSAADYCYELIDGRLREASF